MTKAKKRKITVKPKKLKKKNLQQIKKLHLVKRGKILDNKKIGKKIYKESCKKGDW